MILWKIFSFSISGIDSKESNVLLFSFFFFGHICFQKLIISNCMLPATSSIGTLKEKETN